MTTIERRTMIASVAAALLSLHAAEPTAVAQRHHGERPGNALPASRGERADQHTPKDEWPGAPHATDDGDKEAPSRREEASDPIDELLDVNEMRDVPDEATRAIHELNRDGLRVVLSQDEPLETERSAEQKEVSAEPVTVILRMSGGDRGLQGFQKASARLNLARLLHSLHRVNRIDLGGTNVKDDDLEVLRAFPDLVELALGNTPITDAGLIHVAELRDLTDLSLESTTIGDKGLAHLRALAALVTLTLNETRITDEGLRNLEEMRHLERLSVSSTAISDAGLRLLHDLPIWHLSLRDTKVTDVGLAYLKETMTNLLNLDVSDTEVGRAAIGQFAMDAPHVHVVWGTSFAANPATLEPASQQQVARLNDLLWYLPDGTEMLQVAYGPLALNELSRGPGSEPDERPSTISKFLGWMTGACHCLDADDRSAFDGAAIAMVVNAGRAFHHRFIPVHPFERYTSETCLMFAFERPLGQIGDTFWSGIARRATTLHRCGAIEMAQIDIEYPGETSTTFVAPAHDILLLSNSRDYLTEVLVRKAMNLEELKRSQRSLSSSFPEWEHVDFSARQWGIRHFKHPPDRPLDWPFLGLIYNAEGGDISKISYLCENENAERFVSHNSRFRQYSLRSRQPAIIDVSENVRRKGDLSYFFHHLFNDFTR